MNRKLLTLFTLSPLHIGCGSDVGAVDQPVMRERHTQWPIIPGSTIKGVLADLFLEKTEKEVNGETKIAYTRTKLGEELLGVASTDNKAKTGTLSIGEGTLLAFPVRSAKGCFAWITCPIALQRFAKAQQLAIAPLTLENETCLAPEEVCIKENVVLEEYKFKVAGAVPTQWTDALQSITSVEIWKSIAQRLVVLPDDEFAYFVRNTCEIANHNRIDDVTGVVSDGALFSQENVPSETLFYSPIYAKSPDALASLEQAVSDCDNLLQIGADASTGLGYCNATFFKA